MGIRLIPPLHCDEQPNLKVSTNKVASNDRRGFDTTLNANSSFLYFALAEL